MTSKNAKLLKEFTVYCRKNPKLRFWQALAGWAGASVLLKTDYGRKVIDTFYFEGKDK